MGVRATATTLAEQADQGMSHDHKLEDYDVYLELKDRTVYQIRHRCTECGVWGIGPASHCAGDHTHGHWLTGPDDRYVYP